ncbi:MAG: hypothetical protein AB8B50_08050, partial [Pirellulaceae bacterium]
MKRTVQHLMAMIAVAVAFPAFAAEPRTSKDDAGKADAKKIDLFQAIEDGLIEVDFVPKDASQATVLFKNKTKEPLNLDLPAAFGAVHERKALGQMGGMGGGMGGMGGGMGGMGGGMGGGGMGGG